ncbi:MAG: flavodoxin family protein [Proteobacteria bacterium]|nr:flavodoxin family protein [Pseudomonadota bacterium]MBU1611433.1 flavodoxin family protein [Pseudomonadota bacterium]
MKKPTILGLSASLRNFRLATESPSLAQEIAALDSLERITSYIGEHSKRKRGAKDGLSNSEAALAMALWGAHQEGAEIEHISLSDHFPPAGEAKDLAFLAKHILAADGILLSTPTYFGDRSSASMHFIEMIRASKELREGVRGKVYAGIAVGAKRNGGQETTLIYQMLDLMNCGFIGVGNDSDTTSQYGGTGHAGDIGAMAGDTYGLNTCLGTGRRIARVAAILHSGTEFQLRDNLHLGAWKLQDRNNALDQLLPRLFEASGITPHAHHFDMTDKNIRPCNACSSCPSSIGPDHEYRCFIKGNDGMRKMHTELIKADVLMPIIYSPVDRKGLISSYQEFMERTRYLRRGDYVFSDRLVIPLVFEELGAKENMHIRIITSTIRHHTMMHRPVIGWISDGKLLNPEQVVEDLSQALDMGLRLTAGRLGLLALDSRVVSYNPVGYVLANLDENERENILARQQSSQERKERLMEESRRRLELICDRHARN